MYTNSREQSTTKIDQAVKWVHTSLNRLVCDLINKLIDKLANSWIRKGGIHVDKWIDEWISKWKVGGKSTNW